MADTIEVVDQYIRPSAEYTSGSWLHRVGDHVEVATGYFAIEHPGKPSPYWHGGPPFIVLDLEREWPWSKSEK